MSTIDNYAFVTKFITSTKNLKQQKEQNSYHEAMQLAQRNNMLSTLQNVGYHHVRYMKDEVT